MANKNANNLIYDLHNTKKVIDQEPDTEHERQNVQEGYHQSHENKSFFL